MEELYEQLQECYSTLAELEYYRLVHGGYWANSDALGCYKKTKASIENAIEDILQEIELNAKKDAIYE